MNRLNMDPDGGYPWENDDFRFEQSAVREAIQGIMSAFGINPGDPFLISGFVLNVSTGAYSGGFVYFAGEVFKFDSGVLAPLGVGQFHAFVVDVSYDASGDETLENGDSIRSYEVRKAKIEILEGTPSQPYLSLVGIKTLADKVKSIVDPSNIIGLYGAAISSFYGQWNSVDLTSQNMSFGNNHGVVLAPGANNKFKWIKFGKTVHCNFEVALRSSWPSEGQVILELPNILGSPTHTFNGSGYFINRQYPSYNQGSDIGQHSLWVYATNTGGFRIYTTPSDFKNFYFNNNSAGKDILLLQGNVTFEVQ